VRPRESTAERRLGRSDLAPALGLFALTALSRIPFRSQILYHWDSVNLANGLARLDVLNEHPQPPGYILYVWLCRLVSIATGGAAAADANAAMVWVSVIASGGAVALLYLLATDLSGQRQGVVAAAMLASSPLFWFYGEIALPHALDALLVIAAVWLLARVRRGQRGWEPARVTPHAAPPPGALPRAGPSAYLAVAVLALAGGVRPQTLAFLLPLALYALWPLGWRWMLGAAIGGGILCLGWLLPLLASTGGLAPYLDKTTTYLARFEAETSLFRGAGWPGLMRNGRKLALYTAYALLPALPALLVVPRSVGRHPRRALDGAPAGGWTFLALWVAPALLYYAVIHMGQQGLVFIYLPALILVAAWMLVTRLGERPLTLGLVTLAAAIVSAVTFVALPEYPLGPGTQRLLTRGTIANSDRYFIERLAAVQAQAAPDEAALVGTNWAHLEYYLPQYALLRVDADDSGALRPRGWAGNAASLTTDLQRLVTRREEVTVIFIDPEAFSLAWDDAAIRRIALPTSGELWLQVVPVGHLSPSSLSVDATGGGR
jgi:4-amino-4-deoxy-L-arabinose transferase-like glycosyltransferase